MENRYGGQANVQIEWDAGKRRNPVDCRWHLDRAEIRILAYQALTE
jgi:hypothetical protein